MSENSARILVLEDEKNVGSTLVERLRKEGFEIEWAMNCDEAKMQISGRKFDLALLDVGLPDGNGFEIAELIRNKSRSTALMFLTAWGTPEDRVKGLELGAEDYIVKPFHFKELLLRIQNGLKRARYLNSSDQNLQEPIQLGQAKVWFSRFEIESAGSREHLSHKECAVLKLLFDQKGKVLSRDEILNQVWGEEEFPTSRTVDNFMVRLRKWIEKDPNHPVIIKSIRGVGYQLDLESQ